MWWAVLTGLGVLVAIATLVWRIIAWRFEHVSRVEVTIEPTIRFVGEGDFECYSIVARNRSHHAVELEWPWLEIHQDETPPSRVNIMSFHSEVGIPGVVAPKAKALCWVEKHDAIGLGLLGVPVIACVPSAEGKIYRSKPALVPETAWGD